MHKSACLHIPRCLADSSNLSSAPGVVHANAIVLLAMTFQMMLSRGRLLALATLCCTQGQAKQQVLQDNETSARCTLNRSQHWPAICMAEAVMYRARNEVSNQVRIRTHRYCVCEVTRCSTSAVHAASS